ncbi:putative sporulation protein YtxC [Bacillus sp. FJAT-49736]|uniref:putative sporulation protein YtxC n=1 Tax=Bacillus sp. FJAT-49736 TaxID=2833582 RepID=UPI001BC990E7|nr:putative sporulation protein YtxC [Bacillus sp. FJAT-49736]MBS4173779.1 putative sporulation protein YtxC [Bacillus sp. FJAT-49736]
MDFIFKYMDDAVWLHEYFIQRDKEIWFHETIFQNQKQYFLTIDFSAISLEEVETGFSQFIIQKKRNDWVKDILREYFFFKEEEEQNNILEIVIDMFNGDRPELTSIISEMNETKMIRHAVSALLEQYDTVSFDSLIKFRLKEYYEQIIVYVEIAIDEYKMEQEYQVFIQMLRDYLLERPSKLDVVRIYFEEYGIFYNDQFQEMTKSEIANMLDRRLLTNHPIYIDSVTIAPLLSIAPKKIYLYADSFDNGLIRTLQNIFEERIMLANKEQFWQERNTFFTKLANT